MHCYRGDEMGPQNENSKPKCDVIKFPIKRIQYFFQNNVILISDNKMIKALACVYT